MTCPAEAKVLAVGQIAIFGGPGHPQDTVRLPCDERDGASGVCHGRPSSSRRQHRVGLSDWPRYPYDEPGGGVSTDLRVQS